MGYVISYSDNSLKVKPVKSPLSTAPDVEGYSGAYTLFTWSLSKRWQLYANLGYTLIGEHGTNNEFNYSIGAQFLLLGKWALVGEIFGLNNFNGHKSDNPISSLLGIQHMLSDNLVLDAGVEIGMNKAAPDFRLTTGLT